MTDSVPDVFPMRLGRQVLACDRCHVFGPSLALEVVNEQASGRVVLLDEPTKWAPAGPWARFYGEHVITFHPVALVDHSLVGQSDVGRPGWPYRPQHGPPDTGLGRDQTVACPNCGAASSWWRLVTDPLYDRLLPAQRWFVRCHGCNHSWGPPVKLRQALDDLANAARSGVPAMVEQAEAAALDAGVPARGAPRQPTPADAAAAAAARYLP